MSFLEETAGRGIIVSAVLLPGETMAEGRHFIGRENLMSRLHAMLEYDPIPSARGEIKVMALQTEFEKNKAYWGGDGISFRVSSEFSAADVFHAINRDPLQPLFVVRDAGTGQTLGAPEPEKPLQQKPGDTAEIIPFPKR